MGFGIEGKRPADRMYGYYDHFVDNPASGKVMEICGFRATGDINWLSELYKGDERPVKIMIFCNFTPINRKCTLHNGRS